MAAKHKASGIFGAPMHAKRTVPRSESKSTALERLAKARGGALAPLVAKRPAWGRAVRGGAGSSSRQEVACRHAAAEQPYRAAVVPPVSPRAAEQAAEQAPEPVPANSPARGQAAPAKIRQFSMPAVVDMHTEAELLHMAPDALPELQQRSSGGEAAVGLRVGSTPAEEQTPEPSAGCIYGGHKAALCMSDGVGAASAAAAPGSVHNTAVLPTQRQPRLRSRRSELRQLQPFAWDGCVLKPCISKSVCVSLCVSSQAQHEARGCYTGGVSCISRIQTNSDAGLRLVPARGDPRTVSAPVRHRHFRQPMCL